METRPNVHIVASLAINAGSHLRSNDFKVKVFETRKAADDWFEANKAYLQWAEFSETTETMHKDGSLVRYINKSIEFDCIQGLWIRK